MTDGVLHIFLQMVGCTTGVVDVLPEQAPAANPISPLAVPLCHFQSEEVHHWWAGDEGFHWEALVEFSTRY